MTTGPDASQQKAAKIAALSCLISFATVVAVNFGIFGRLMVGGPAQTGRNILANERLYRVGIAGDAFYSAGVIVVAAALYVVLKPIDQNLALLAAFGRLVHAGTWLLVTVNLFTALRVLRYADPSAARPFLNGFDPYYVGLLFWSLGATIGAWLWFESGYIPRSLAAFGIISSAWCAVCTFVFFIFPGFAAVVNLWWFDSPMALFEVALSFVLLFRGLKTPRRPITASASTA